MPDATPVASIETVPEATPVVRPLLVELSIVAIALSYEDHVTDVVKFCELLSVYVPVAVYRSVAPVVIEPVAGETAIETSSAAITVKVLDPLVSLLLIPLRLAEIVTISHIIRCLQSCRVIASYQGVTTSHGELILSDASSKYPYITNI